MSDAKYDVIFSGRLIEGAAEDQVKANVAMLFKTEVAKIERLFDGSPAVIKKGVDAQTAKKYLLAMKKAGAICEARVVGQAVEQPSAAETPAAKEAGTRRRSEAEIAAGEGGQTKYVIKEAPKGLGALASADIDEPGVVLVEHREPPPPQVDTSGLSMDEPGAVLVEQEQAEPELQVDTSGLSMDEPGVTLVEGEEVPELEVDTSELSMDEPGVIIVEHEEPEEPEIDTSKLSLS